MGRNNYFQLKQFKIVQEQSAMKVGVDGVLLGAWVMAENPLKILDIGTGTGLIALMMAQRFPLATIDAVEIDEEACREAVFNFEQSPWSDRLKVVNVPFRQFSGSCATKYDLIVCNPPFFENSVNVKNRARELARNSENLTLEDLFGGVREVLAGKGIFAMVFPASRFNEMMSIASENKLGLHRLTRIQPNPEKEAHRVLAGFSFEPDKLTEDNLIIESVLHHDYTEDYRSLTRDFYLYF